MSDNNFKNAFEYKVIYVFSIEDEKHKGLVKIGDATLKTDVTIDVLSPNCRELNQAAIARIKAYTNTAGITPKLLHTELAVRTVKEKNGTTSLKAFRDHEVQAVLKNSGYDNIQIGDTTGKEWFDVDVETAKKAVDAVKHNYSNLSNTSVVKQAPIIFRPEQTECINKVIKHFKKADRFLINAKMRYGKTFVSLEIVKQSKFKKTIIMTHRPVVDAGWYEDFTKIFSDAKDYIYGSKSSGYTLEQLLKTNKPFIYFASVQDLRGSSQVGGKFDKNDLVFNTNWDCVIVDEAHEGTTTALGEDTVNAVVKEGSGTKFLALSGTPFNILTEYDEDSIYTWDYIMEQENKSEWDKLHFGDSNPYEELPELRIYTYDLGDILHNSNYITFEDKAFNFHEFFRTWTGDFSKDYADMPSSASVGDFVHESDVKSFLNLMTKDDRTSSYPFSTEEYRNLFKHSLWMVPGVREAKALKNLMLKHPIFGNGMFDIVNVAGDGDEEEKSEEALTKVRNAIKSAGSENYTITLSCGKLTTGVTVKEWTAVFMLSGTFSTSAANYLQTIFRVQSPCNEDGKIKETGYVFDFAPDRTLKMVSSAVSVSSKAGKTKVGDAATMGKFLNYCPVIAVSGSEMKEYSATRLLQQLKKAYADKVVKNGFDDSNLYNDELFKLQAVDIQKFDELKGIIGTSKATQKQNDITVNDQGLTNEEYEESEKLKKKPKKELTPEEKARIEELKQMKKLRNDAISILRGISIRMPLLIYGADIPYDEEITLEKFVDMVDDSSWEEFMPTGVTKDKFKEFQKYYDEEIFIAAGRRVRNIAREADTYGPTERVIKIASLFRYFKNPDKETVLTPWRVVNMHMSDCIGGWDFYDELHEEELEIPRFVDKKDITQQIFFNPQTQILEINSKTGLYPLYVANSTYMAKCQDIKEHDLTLEKKRELWFETVAENIFVVCKTPMAKAITKRTLVGYSNNKINAHYFDDLNSTMANKPKLFIDKVLKPSYWKKGSGDKMHFNAIVGNPPYQENISDNDSNSSLSKQLFPIFVETAVKLDAEYVSLITPSRWFAGDAQDKSFVKMRDFIRENNHITYLCNYKDEKDLFSNVEIKGGVSYFLYDKNYNGQVMFVNRHNDTEVAEYRELFEDGLDIIISDSESYPILKKVRHKDTFVSFVTITTGRNAFGIIGKQSVVDDISSAERFKGAAELRCKGNEIRWMKPSAVTKSIDIFNKYKVYISKSAGNPNSDTKVIGIPYVGEPLSACTDSLFPIGCFDTLTEAQNLKKYMQTKFLRFLVQTLKVSQNVTQIVYKFVPMQNFTNDSDIDWTQTTKKIDEQLYQKYGLSGSEISYIENLVERID